MLFNFFITKVFVNITFPPIFFSMKKGIIYDNNKYSDDTFEAFLQFT